jgi:hypothetical protein
VKSPMKCHISREHPLLILMANSPPNSHHMAGDYHENARIMVDNWASLSALEQGHATIQIEGICDDYWRRVEVLLPYAEDAGIPITLQTQTNNADINDTMPLDQTRRILDQYNCIVGLQLSEASQRTFVGHGAGPEYSMGRNARYARDVIRLAGEYGLFMSWQLMSENFAAIGCSGDNEALFDTVVEYGEYVIPMHEMNSEFAKYIDHLAAMGLWISGSTANWGVEGQSWYWADAGYAAPGTVLPGSLEMPGELYSIMMLLGATAGATAYSIEPPWDIWPGEGGRHRFTDWISPTFERLVTEQLIPSRGEVVETMPVAYHLPRCTRHSDFRRVSDDLDFDHGEGNLIRGTYGVFDRARDAELIPNNSRFGWIPVLPAKTPRWVLNAFDLVLHPGDIQSAEQATELLGRYFPETDRGDAWSMVVGSLSVAANSHENWPVAQSVRLQVPAPPTQVQLDQGVLTWSLRAGDVSYRVWRMRSGVEECLTPQAISANHLALSDRNTPRDGDMFAVSAITSAIEPFVGTLHLHQFILLNNRESRRSLWVNTQGNTTSRARFAENMPGESDDIERMERRAAECTLVEDLASPIIEPNDESADVKRGIMDALVTWKHVIENEDIDALEELFTPSYADPDGRTVESLLVAFRILLQRYLVDELAGLDREWHITAAWQNPVVRLFTRDWIEVGQTRVVVDVACEMWAGGGPELEPSDMFRYPIGGKPKAFRITWVMTPTGWKIEKMDPPFLRAEDVVRFRMRYQGW